ncbi:MAG: YraN family protein [Rhodothermales bacterium]|nr:YraN family protein [Rhodothermales bacterium]
MSDRQLGQRGESIAAEYLEQKGIRVLDRNYRFERNEIDLVCFDPDGHDAGVGEIVFVEVKTRSGDAFGRPEEAVTPEKRDRIVAASRAYLYEKKLEGAACRFDVVSIIMRDVGADIDHFKDAFWD